MDNPGRQKNLPSRGRSQLSRYVHSGGFNRLKGRPQAPGSAVPEKVLASRRRMLLILAAVIVLIGLYFVFF